MSLPIFVERDPPWVYLTFKYNQDVVDDLKWNLPSYARRWNPEERAWMVTEDRYDDAIHILKDHDYIVHHRRQYDRGRQRKQEAPPPPPRERPQSSAHRVLYVSADAPPEVIRAAYRALSKLHHPDIGGDEEKMKEVNEAWSKLNP